CTCSFTGPTAWRLNVVDGSDFRRQFVCKVCKTNKVENEMHFITECPLYNLYRDDLFYKIDNISQGKWKLNNLPHSTQFKILMSGTNDSYELQIFACIQAYLTKCFKLRQLKLDE